jgi:hypothetical protein
MYFERGIVSIAALVSWPYLSLLERIRHLAMEALT